MEEFNLAKKANGGFIKDITLEELEDSNENSNICKAIRRVFPCSYDDESLIRIYYTNQFLLQDIMELEIKKHVIMHLDRLVKRCRNYGVNLDDARIKEGIFRWFRDATKEDGLFHSEIAWFMSDADGGGIYDSNPISDMVSDYMEEDEDHIVHGEKDKEEEQIIADTNAFILRNYLFQKEREKEEQELADSNALIFHINRKENEEL